MLSSLDKKPAPSLLRGPYPQRKTGQAPGLADTVEAGIAALLQRWRLRPGRLKSRLGDSESSPMLQVLQAWQAIHGAPCNADIAVAAQAMQENRTLIELADRDACEQAAVIAACSMALKGLPVHLVYADVFSGESVLAALAEQLGLHSAVVEEGSDVDARRTAYAADIVTVSCRQLLFDYLMDQKALGSSRGQIASRLKLQSPGGRSVLLPGLSCALIVDAREVLIEQARRPVGISEPGEREASHVDSFHREAVEIASRLVLGEDYLPEDAHLAPVLTEAGREKVGAASVSLGPLWSGEQRSQNVVVTALLAAAMEADLDFEFRGEEIVLKKVRPDLICPEGIGPSDYRKLLAAYHDKATETSAMPVKTRLSVQHLFPRYIQLAACGWVLAPRLTELQQVYGLVSLPGFNTQKPVQPAVNAFASRSDWKKALLDRLNTLHQANVNVLILSPDEEAHASLQNDVADQAWSEAVCSGEGPTPAVVSGLMLSCTVADALLPESDASRLSFQHVIFAGAPLSLLDEQLLSHRFNDDCELQTYACSSDAVFEQCSVSMKVLVGHSAWLNTRVRRRLETRERANRDQVAAHDAYLRQALAFSGETL
ncbi:hypothetical protein EYC87_07820 [Halieaceae bacterium IMCC8485]|uniref:SecA family profile domain-containing protein n=1 Tax=Candidatus Seongchinamella marina TaxID=2518990 RepID=A0ABT3SU26_9GAMM|nr:hypothetical protein [Candidatus Seongchinamella marina]MCX2973491.1 hypothetical protein [Candidatus Seongchinamella marina]